MVLQFPSAKLSAFYSMGISPKRRLCGFSDTG
ncbi:hypothetical protein FOPG_06828 [Fusarium oxysporum f. sp. conglutinans race 2 54008]|uniref:Uncharacterized protein n=1 Tax=Fusarium oxysporum f. sp. conglutinans race 2 54008 TaxID=1089457 RepID=X0HS95_FUSOX|nr:hypothetical protein FOPG_06828 [Fusarium oxysporum f. sp. conglutinans race 2 54008]